MLSHGVGCSTHGMSLSTAYRRFRSGCAVAVLSFTHICVAQELPSKNPPILEAAYAGDAAKVKSLLSGGANPNVSNINGVTPLMFAAMGKPIDGQRPSCALDAIALLLQRGANPNAAAANGFTALIGAASTSNLECIQLLLKMGANVNAKTSQGDTPLREATMHGDLKAVLLLIQAGAHLDDTDQNGRTPLLNAIAKSVPGSSALSPYETIAIALLQAGANTNIADRNGQSAITLAAAMNATVLAYPLLEYHANVNTVDPSAAGATPLIIAADHGNIPLVKELLRYRPDLNLRDRFGKTALDYAREKQEIDIISVLTKAEAKQ